MDTERLVGPEEHHCAACGVELEEREQGRPVCAECDEQLDRELAAWLAFVKECSRAD